jgi:hypothetical protein
MTQMAQIDRIRHLIFVEGCSQRSVARALHCFLPRYLAQDLSNSLSGKKGISG